VESDPKAAAAAAAEVRSDMLKGREKRTVLMRAYM
jgi:hypothetical protein